MTFRAISIVKRGLMAKLATFGLLLAMSSTIQAQQFPDGLLGYSSAPGLSESCSEALNTTVTSCPVYLANVAVDSTRLGAPSLDIICTAACKFSLQKVRGIITGGCKASTDVLKIQSVVYPATFIIDNLLYAYEMSCAKDRASGQFCDNLYLDALANDTKVDVCSECALSGVQRQLNSPFGYNAEFARNFQSITAKCGATGYAFTSPAQYAISTTTMNPDPTLGPKCASPYVVQQNDTCHAISTAKSISFFSVVKAAGTDTACSILKSGAKICLPQSCAVYRVQYDDTCQSIVASNPGLRASDLLIWNPDIDPLCTNLEYFADKLICVSPPGRSLSDVTRITEAPTPTQAPPTAVPRPANAKAESNARCAAWYEVKQGDYCQAISIRNGITMQDFLFLNPSVDKDCTNLWLQTSYCIQAVGDINTYSSYPYSSSPAYTLTASAYQSTSVSLIASIVPTATPLVKLPMAPGSHTEADGCVDFVNYYNVVPQMDQSVQTYAPVASKNINACSFAASKYKVWFDDFLSWNPSLKSIDPCFLQKGYRYCIAHQNATGTTSSSIGTKSTSPTTSTVNPGAPTQTGIIAGCRKFYTAKSGDGCWSIANGNGVSLDDFYRWNPAVGTDCANLWLGYAYCVQGPTAASPPPTTTSSSGAVPPPGPTQAGVTGSCKKWHNIIGGDGCPAIQKTYNIASFSTLLSWNPSIGSNCENLWVGYSLCVLG